MGQTPQDNVVRPDWLCGRVTPILIWDRNKRWGREGWVGKRRDNITVIRYDYLWSLTLRTQYCILYSSSLHISIKYRVQWCLRMTTRAPWEPGGKIHKSITLILSLVKSYNFLKGGEIGVSYSYSGPFSRVHFVCFAVPTMDGCTYWDRDREPT